MRLLIGSLSLGNLIANGGTVASFVFVLTGAGLAWALMR